nr:hypothetical protein Iba_chr09bCG1680 [Ipomoea batatas]
MAFINDCSCSCITSIASPSSTCSGCGALNTLSTSSIMVSVWSNRISAEPFCDGFISFLDCVLVKPLPLPVPGELS